MIRIQRKDKMYRVVWWIKPHIVLATNFIVNPWIPMMVKIFFRLHEHQLGHGRTGTGEDTRYKETLLPASKRRYFVDHA